MPVGIPRWKGRLAPSAELEGVPMPIVGGLDIHRKRIAFDYLDTVTGEVRRGQIAPADRAHLRAWLVRFAGGPCRDSRPGERLESEEYTVMPSPANRTALREEENRPCPASQQVSASAVTGPAPYSLAARTPGAGQVPGSIEQFAAQRVQPALDGGGHVQGGGDLQLPVRSMRGPEPGWGGSARPSGCLRDITTTVITAPVKTGDSVVPASHHGAVATRPRAAPVQRVRSGARWPRHAQSRS